MDILKTRHELRRMAKANLFKLALDGRMSYCLVGRTPCGLLLHYKGSTSCVSEILGKGCQVERLEQLEEARDQKEKVTFSLPFPQRTETELLFPRKKAVEFKVYHRDRVTGSIVFLGKIIERRRKERGKNLKALLSKAVQEYSDYVEESSTIFLLG